MNIDLDDVCTGVIILLLVTLIYLNQGSVGL
jgi:hypothetical protein